jgi:uncharacterized protein YcbK (DUF882 family)
VTAASKNFSAEEVRRASHSLALDDFQRLRPAMQRTLDVLEKVREVLGVPIRIESFARSAAHNAKVKGSPTSDHLTGYAADIVVLGGMSNATAYEKLRHNVAALKIDQLIYDPADQSLHIGTGPQQRARAWIESSLPGDELVSRVFGSSVTEAQKIAALGFSGLALLLAAALVLTSEKRGNRG